MSTIGALPDRQVRARALTSGAVPKALVTGEVAPLDQGAQIVCLGSRLAPALATVLETRGYRRIRTDAPHPALPALEPEAEDYAASGTLVGPLGSPVAVEQLVRRCLGEFKPAEDRWHDGDLVIDPYRPGLRYPARSDREFDVLTERHLTGLRSALRRAGAVVLAFDTIEICEAIADGAVLPVWPDTLDPTRYRIRTLTAKEVGDAVHQAVQALRRINPDVHVLLMISPEPIAATTMARHVLTADSLIKATLRLAIEHVLSSPSVFYLPALELAAHLGIAADTVTADARFLSALAEALIAAEVVAPGSDPDTPAAPEPDGAKPAVRGERKGRRPRAKKVETPAQDAAAPAMVEEEARQSARKPGAEKRNRRRQARAVEASEAPPAAKIDTAAEKAPRRRRTAKTEQVSTDAGTPEITTRPRRRRAAEAGTAPESAAAGRAGGRRARRAAQEAETPAPAKAVLAKPVDESGFQEPKRKRGRRAAGEQSPEDSGTKRRGRRKKEA